jgi:antitoxin VapB
MALSIKNPEAERLARALARLTGESITDAVIAALRERLKRKQGRRGGADLVRDVMEISRRCAALPVLDPRQLDDILGYGKSGSPQ